MHPGKNYQDIFCIWEKLLLVKSVDWSSDKEGHDWIGGVEYNRWDITQTGEHQVEGMNDETGVLFKVCLGGGVIGDPYALVI